MAGFALAAASGVCLLSANALEYESNPVLLVKFAAIGLGLVNAVAVRRTAAWQGPRIPHRCPDSETQASWRSWVAVSLVSWLTAVAAGRIIGYW